MNTFEIISAFLQGLGIVAVAVRLHEMALQRCSTPKCERVAAAMTCVAGVVVAMGFPLKFAPGVVFDLRHVFLIIAASYGGWQAALMTAAAAAAFRVMEDGPGVSAGLAGIAISALVGLGLAALHAQRELSAVRLWLHGLSASLSLSSVFLLPWPFSLEVFQSVAVPFIIINFAGVLIAGDSLNKYRRKMGRERDLVRETWIDPVTGLANRRAFDTLGPGMARDAIRDSGGYAMMIIDVDTFKSINDTFGHARGDTVLRRISDTVAGMAREHDLVARFGGDEIVLVLPGCDRVAAQKVADRILTGVSAVPFEVDGVHLRLTVSIGFAVTDTAHKSFNQAFEEADAALYRAKKSGRNRAEMAVAA